MDKSPERISLEKHLIALLKEQQAHVTFEDSVKNVRPELYGEKVEQLPYSLWQLVEHLRIAQADILDFSQNKDYKPLQWPKDYWPESPAPEQESDWDKSIQSIIKEREDFIDLLQNTDNLYAPFPHGDGQTMLREAMLIADHTAYHTGQIIVIRRLLGDYE